MVGNQRELERSYPSRLFIILIILILGLVIVFGVGASTGALAKESAGSQLVSSCAAGNVPGLIESDTTLGGDLYVTSDVIVRNGATLTLTAGAHVTMCAEYDLQMTNGMLHAVGTATEPIIFDSDDPAQKWGALDYIGNGSTVLTSTLQYLELNNGGGSDANAAFGAIHVLGTWDGTAGYSPVIDHVTVNDSGAYGIYVWLHEDDPTPPAISNVTVTGSAAAPLSLGAAAVGGLGGGNSLGGNGRDAIQVRTGTIRYSQNWRSQPIPYELTGPVLDVFGSEEPVLTLQPGVVLWMGADSTIRMQGGGLVAEGTAASPITITRAGNNGPLWDRIYFSQSALPESRLAHAHLSYAGSTLGTLDVRVGGLSLDHVTVQHNPNGAGVRAEGPFIEITDSAIEFNKTGVQFTGGADGVLRNNVMQGNVDGGVLAVSNGNVCVDAIGNDWGNASGPTDSSAALDACNQAKTHSGGGDAVSDGVLYEPWLAGDPADQSSITPEPYWIVADDLDEGLLTITVRDANGQPLPGKTITLETTRGTIEQPAAPTDANGVTTAVIRSPDPGEAIITARNETDDTPLAAIAAVNFWQGYGNTGPLIDPSGVPYASPELLVAGEPFQEGFPMTFRVPMQNSSAGPVDVEVVYGVSNFGLGVDFTSVGTETMTLAPGESWDALGGWVPDHTGHTCVRATIASDVALSLLGLSSPMGGNAATLQKNKNVNSGSGGSGGSDGCGPPPDSNDMIPDSPDFNGRDDLENVAKHERNMLDALLYAVCEIRNLWDPPSHGWEEIADVPLYSPPTISPGPGVTPAQAAALNEQSQLSARLTGLYEAMVISLDRMNGASQAGEWYWAAVQLEAFRNFVTEAMITLRAHADSVDDLLAATEGAGIPDVTLKPADYAAELQQLQTQGFSAETLAYLQATGYADDLIDQMLADNITRLEQVPVEMTTFYTVLANQRDSSLALADDLETWYGPSSTLLGPAGTSEFVATPPQFAGFTVGNPTDSQATVDLRIRPVDVPIDWTYSLSDPAPDLAPGETTDIFLRMNQGGAMLRGRMVTLAVEGYIDDEYIGGVLIQQRIPVKELSLHLPLIIHQ